MHIVVDIETDGPVPALHSMLSIGAVATTDTDELGEFYRKLIPLTEARPDPATMDWWQSQPEAWQEVTTDAQPAALVMEDFLSWATGFGDDIVFVAQPVGFDYLFVSWYLWRFTTSNPFKRMSEGYEAALDISSFISGKYNMSLKQSARRQLPEWMKQGMPHHSHNALEDARGYAVILRNVLGEKL